jgi:hypothetical protein
VIPDRRDRDHLDAPSLLAIPIWDRHPFPFRFGVLSDLLQKRQALTFLARVAVLMWPARWGRFIQSLYSKLNVVGKGMALNCARQISLLGPQSRAPAPTPNRQLGRQARLVSNGR